MRLAAPVWLGIALLAGLGGCLQGSSFDPVFAISPDGRVVMVSRHVGDWAEVLRVDGETGNAEVVAAWKHATVGGLDVSPTGEVYASVTRTDEPPLRSALWRVGGAEPPSQVTEWGEFIQWFDVSRNGTLVYDRGPLTDFGPSQLRSWGQALYRKWPGGGEVRLTGWDDHGIGPIVVLDDMSAMASVFPDDAGFRGWMAVDLVTGGSRSGPEWPLDLYGACWDDERASFAAIRTGREDAREIVVWNPRDGGIQVVASIQDMNVTRVCASADMQSLVLRQAGSEGDRLLAAKAPDYLPHRIFP